MIKIFILKTSLRRKSYLEIPYNELPRESKLCTESKEYDEKFIIQITLSSYACAILGTSKTFIIQSQLYRQHPITVTFWKTTKLFVLCQLAFPATPLYTYRTDNDQWYKLIKDMSITCQLISWLYSKSWHPVQLVQTKNFWSHLSHSQPEQGKELPQFTGWHFK